MSDPERQRQRIEYCFKVLEEALLDEKHQRRFTENIDEYRPHLESLRALLEESQQISVLATKAGPVEHAVFEGFDRRTAALANLVEQSLFKYLQDAESEAVASLTILQRYQGLTLPEQMYLSTSIVMFMLAIALGGLMMQRMDRSWTLVGHFVEAVGVAYLCLTKFTELREKRHKEAA